MIAVDDHPGPTRAEIDLDRVAEPRSELFGVGDERPELVEGGVEIDRAGDGHRFHAVTLSQLLGCTSA
jgi:hypothetical protein